MLRIHLLGKFEVRRENQPLAIPSRPAQSLLAYLAMTAGTHHRREQLAGILWPDMDETRARNNLRQALWRLQSAIGDSFIAADKIAIAFDPATDYWLDVSIMNGLNGDESPLKDLLQAASVYEGQLLPGFYDSWIVHEREQLEAIFNQTMRALCGRLGSKGRWLDVIGQAERWLAVGGISESAFRALITAHSAMGDVAAVSAAYQRCVKVLGDELGLEPSPETRGLYDAALAKAGFPVSAERPLDSAQRHHLPVNLSTFIGRDADMSEIEGLLAEPATRLLTLSGAGGIGKTRLAIQVGFRVADKFTDGIGYVELAALRDAESVPQSVASSLGLQEKIGQSWLASLLNYLRARRLLLILDNCEHLIDACSQVADTLLRACPDLQILATSRETFGLTGETIYHVRSLSVPDPLTRLNVQTLADFEAVRLFAERAKYLDGFSLSDENGPSVALVCARLDGMPLAIELAAARVKALKVEQIAARLDDRFRLLTSGSRTALPRHQTLRATIDWSYDPLDEGEKLLLRRLGVFAGGWTLESAEAICGQGLLFDMLDGLQSLLDKSLIQHVSAVGTDSRFTMLETIREYAVEKLEESGKAEAVREAHAAAFLKVAEESEHGMTGATVEHWWARMADDNENIRAALRFNLERGDVETALRMAGALRRSWWLHGQYSEAQYWLGAALAATGKSSPAVRAKALIAFADISNIVGDYDTGMPLLEEALKLCRAIGDEQGIAECQFHLGEALWFVGQTETAAALIKESLDKFKKLGIGRRIAPCLYYLATISSERGQSAQSRSLFEESHAAAHEQGDKFIMGAYQIYFAQFLIREGDFAQAMTVLKGSVALLRDLKVPEVLAWSLASQALAVLRLGDPQHAQTLIREALEVLAPLGVKHKLAVVLEISAAIHVAQGSDLKAARLFGAAEALRESIHVPLAHVDILAYEKDIATGRARVGEAGWSASWQEGRQMSPEDAFSDGP